jgi:hypothetical protein
MSLLLKTITFQNLINGRSPLSRQPVRAATTSDITLSGNQIIDGYSLLNDMRVLVKNQTNTAQNGIYIVADGSWTRAADFIGHVSGISVYVQHGNINGNNLFMCNNYYGEDVVETDNLTFQIHLNSNDLANISNRLIKSSKLLVNVSTPATAKFSVENLTGSRVFDVPNITSSSDSLATNNSSSTLIGKTFIDLTTYISSSGDNSKKIKFQVSGVSSGTTRVFTVPDYTSAVLLDTAAQTISDKTYITPIIDEIKNASGKVLEFKKTSAINDYIQITSGTNESIIDSAGSSSNLNLNLKTKSGINLRSDVRYYSGSSTSSNYVGLKADPVQNVNVSFKLPTKLPNNRAIMRFDSDGQLSFANDRITYTMSSTSHIISKTPLTIPTSVFVWNNAFYGTNGAFRFVDGYATYIYVANLAAIGREITVQIINTNNNTVLGTNTNMVTLAGTYPVRFQFTLPTVDCRIQFRASASGINGVISLFAGSLDYGK